MADWPTLDQLKERLNVTSDSDDVMLQLALDAGVEQVQHDTYGSVADFEEAHPTDIPAKLVLAALIQAVMTYKAPDAPFGVAAVFDTGGLRVSADHATYQKLLSGYRQQLRTRLMADPVDGLVTDILAALSDAGLTKVNVLDGPTPQIKAPAVVIRPDTPWVIHGPNFCYDEQRYQAIMVVTAATPGDGRRTLYAISQAIRSSLTEGWSWESVNAPIVDETTGVPFLAAAMRLLYQNTEEEES